MIYEKFNIETCFFSKMYIIFTQVMENSAPFYPNFYTVFKIFIQN